MKSRYALLLLLVLVACEPGSRAGLKLQRSDLVGSWYGIYSHGDATILFDSVFYPDGRVETLYYTCLSDKQLALAGRTGTWSFANDTFTLAYDDDGNPSAPFVASYRITATTPDFVRYVGVESGTKFWKERKWSTREYNCATSKADIDRDRHAAIADGRADPHTALTGTTP